MRRGIFIAETGKSVGKNTNKFESDKPHLQVNLVREPFHLDIQDFNGGTNFVSPGGGSPFDQQETLFSIRHGLPYTPEVLFYLYVVSYDGLPTDPKAGAYSNTRLSYASGLSSDLVYAEVDSDEFKIIHRLKDDFGFGLTSDADSYALRLKYYILSNDSHTTSYNTSGF